MKVYMVDAGFIETDSVDGTLVSQQDWVCEIFDTEEKAVEYMIDYVHSRLCSDSRINREEYFVRYLARSAVVPGEEIWYAVAEPLGETGYWIRYREYELK